MFQRPVTKAWDLQLPELQFASLSAKLILKGGPSAAHELSLSIPRKSANGAELTMPGSLQSQVASEMLQAGCTYLEASEPKNSWP